jgi:hypothetical protein
MTVPYSDADAAFDREAQGMCPKHGATPCTCCSCCGGTEKCFSWCREPRFGHLIDSTTHERIRPATKEEQDASANAGLDREGHIFVEVDGVGRKCYVTD